jgi:hypothetical protein
MVYASYRVLNSLLPDHAQDWREMVSSAGLDPDDDSQDVTTAVGVGNVAGAAVVTSREHDGMNQLGDEGGGTYNAQPYADNTDYQPVNTAYELVDPTRWQPLVVTERLGSYRVQQFVTPQMRLTTPYSYRDPNRFRAPPPTATPIWNCATGYGSWSVIPTTSRPTSNSSGACWVPDAAARRAATTAATRHRWSSSTSSPSHSRRCMRNDSTR